MCCPYGDAADFRRSRTAFVVDARRNGLRVAGALAGVENLDILQSDPPFATRLMDVLPASYLRLAQVGAQT